MNHRPNYQTTKLNKQLSISTTKIISESTANPSHSQSRHASNYQSQTTNGVHLNFTVNSKNYLAAGVMVRSRSGGGGFRRGIIVSRICHRDQKLSISLPTGVANPPNHPRFLITHYSQVTVTPKTNLSPHT